MRKGGGSVTRGRRFFSRGCVRSMFMQRNLVSIALFINRPLLCGGRQISFRSEGETGGPMDSNLACSTSNLMLRCASLVSGVTENDHRNHNFLPVV